MISSSPYVVITFFVCVPDIKLKVDLVADPIMKMVDEMHHVSWGAMYAVEESLSLKSSACFNKSYG